MLKLYDGTTSVCAIKVRLALFEKSIPFDSHNIDLRAGDQFDPAYLKLNPNAVVPTLDDGGNIVTESSVIMAYLEDRFADAPSLLPDAPFDRARMRLWMKRVDDVVHPSIGTLTHRRSTGRASWHLMKTAAQHGSPKFPMPIAANGSPPSTRTGWTRPSWSTPSRR